MKLLLTPLNLFDIKNIFDYISLEGLIICSVLLALILCFAIYIIIYCAKSKKRKKKMLEKAYNVRVYTINYKLYTISYFDKSNISKPINIDTESFYNTFSSQDQKRLQVWLQELQKEQHSVPHHLSVTTYIKRNNKYMYSLLDVTSINYEKGIIHLESHLFPNIVPTNTKKTNKIYLKTESELTQLFPQNKLIDKASLLVISLFPKNQFSSKSNFKADHLIVTQITSKLVRYLSSSRYLILLKNNEIAVLDTKTKTANDALLIAQQLSQELVNYLNINLIDDIYDFRIGVVFEKKFAFNFKKLVKKAREMTLYAANSDMSSHVSLYSKEINLNNSHYSTIIDEINNLIKNEWFEYSYQPFISADTKKIQGFYVDVMPINTILKSIRDVEEYAFNSGLIDKIIDITNEGIVKTFTKQNIDFKYPAVFFVDSQISFTEILLKCLDKKKPFKATQVYFTYQDTELIIYNEEKEDLQEQLTNLKDHDQLLALIISSFSIELTEDALSTFDAFMLNDDLVNSFTITTKGQILIRALIEKLKAYGKPIYAFNVSKWSIIEYLIKNGIHVISSPLIYPEEHLYELNNKKINKFSSFVDTL